jgi:hypothetical protein
MATSYTSLLGLALPVTGELQGAWGDVVNDSITSLLDGAVAGTTTLSTDGDVTLTTTTGAANQARQAILLCSGARTAIRTITAPAHSKIYTIINATTGGFDVKIVGVGPTTGISIPAGFSATVAWNGSDFIDATTFFNVAPAFGSLTAGRVVYTDANKKLATSANLLFDATTLTLGANPVLSAGTANGVAYANGSKVLTTGSALTFDGANFGLGASPTAYSSYRVQTITGPNSTYGGLIDLAVSDRSSIFRIQNDLNTSQIGTLTAHPLVFNYNASEQMRLTSTGLGIGTSSPAYKLDVSGSDGVTARIKSTSGSTGNYAQLTLDSYNNYSGSGQAYIRGVSSASSNSNTDLSFGVNSSGFGAPFEAMRLNASGNLGLGVTPSAWDSTFKAFQVGSMGAVSAYTVSPNLAFSVNNVFSGGGNKYIGSGYATLYQQSSTNGNHAWYTAPSGNAGNAISFTQAMTLDASGNLGVGTTSPDGKLVVLGTAGSNPYSHFKDASGADFFIQAVGNSDCRTGTASNHPWLMFTNGTERARIDSSGNFVVGDTSANGRLGSVSSLNGKVLYGFSTASAGFTDAILVSEFRSYSPNNTTARFLYCGDNAAERFTIRSNGGLANYQANNVNLSDRREKTNFSPAKSYLETICAIPVQTFNYIDQNMEEDPGLTLGVAAQDVQSVAPELVMESNWGTEDNPKMRLSIYQTDLQYALMRCIQEQQAIIESLKARLDAANL